MNTQEYTSVKLLSSHYKVPVSFIKTIHEFDLIEIVTIENEAYVHNTQIKDIEKIMRLHFELDINLEGIDAIYNLLRRVESLKQDILTLNNKLNSLKNL